MSSRRERLEALLARIEDAELRDELRVELARGGEVQKSLHEIELEFWEQYTKRLQDERSPVVRNQRQARGWISEPPRTPLRALIFYQDFLQDFLSQETQADDDA